MMTLETASDPLVTATWWLVGATIGLAIVGFAAALFAGLAYWQAKKTDAFTKRHAYRDEFMNVHAGRLGGRNPEGDVHAEAISRGWGVPLTLIPFIYTVGESTRGTDYQKDAWRVANQIVRDALADWVADGKNVRPLKRAAAIVALESEFERKMRSGEIAGTKPHPDFALKRQGDNG